ncbi:hypothetical protein BHM03_00061790 [Ensete ventricosum]|nr:hypothetical protein BHM03_00061790 [Ensete ventricosum]
MLVKNLRACAVGAVCASVSAEWARLVLARVPELACSHLGGEEVEHGWMEGALGSGSAGRRLAHWSSGREEMPLLRSTSDSCKKVGSGGVLDVTPQMVKLV